MGISVNDFSSENLSGKVYSKYSTNEINTNVTDDASSSYLDFEGYLKLLTSQMSNQDFNNAMSDSEFIQQMASYSMMEAISQLTKQNSVNYASSLIGKAVTVQNGNGAPETGLVESVTLTSDGCKILVNGSLYNTDGITDVVDGTVYSQLRSFVGHTVEVKDGDTTVTGEVTGIIIKNGSGYIILDNKEAYDMNAITNVIKPEESEGENSETEENPESSSESVQSAEVEENTAGTSNNSDVTGTVYSSQAAYDTLMKMLDSKDNEESSAADLQTKTATVNSNMDMSRYMTSNVSSSLAASGLADDYIPAPYSFSGNATATNYNNQSAVSSSNASSGLADERIPDPYPYQGYQTAADTSDNRSAASYNAQSSSSSYDKGEVSGVVKVSDNTAESTSLSEYGSENTISSIPKSTRKYADQYPVEAAFADSVRTTMCDIRFIGNTRVNSVIDTSKILCYSPSGKAVTDIGWCGKGRLGEVITYADGTQRVEIIGPIANSYLYTSGNFTLDEICDFSIRDGSLSTKLNSFETVIRHFGRDYTAEERRQLDQFAEYASWHANTFMRSSN